MKKIIFFTSLLLIIGCNDNNRKSEKTSNPKEVHERVVVPDYSILLDYFTETRDKAQIELYAVYKDSVVTKDAIRTVLLKIFIDNKNRDKFENFDSPTVVAVYLFASEEAAEKDKSAFIARLIKRPANDQLEIYYNENRLNSIKGLDDDVLTKDEIMLGKIKKYLQDRGLELCDLNNILGDIELSSIRKADAKYPDYGSKHMKYSSQLIESEKRKLAQKHNLADSIFMQTAVFAMYYCN